jgi:hypothetical protein
MVQQRSGASNAPGHAPIGSSSAPDRHLVLSGEEVLLIPPGTYTTVVAKAATFPFRSSQNMKLALAFTVLVPDAEARHGVQNVPLYRYYNVKVLPGRRLRAPRHSDFARDYALITGKRITRWDRLSTHLLAGVLCEVEVATVTHDARQRLIPEPAQYSKIGRVIRRLAGSPKSCVAPVS